MASIGTVQSPALSGEAAPVFKATERRKVVAEVSEAVQESNAQLSAEVAELKALVAQLVTTPKEETPKEEAPKKAIAKTADK